MVSDSAWKKDASGIEHPAHSILLAFIREQCPEHEKRIHAHLALCDQCGQTYAGLSQTSNTLNNLEQMPRYLRYPELEPELVLAHAQRGVPLRSAWTGRRKREMQGKQQEAKRVGARFIASAPKPSLRMVSLPASFGLLLLCIVGVLMVAYALVNIVKPPLLPGDAPVKYHVNNQPNSALLEGHTPTPSAVVVSSMPGPVIALCSSPGDTRLVICGSGFKPKDRVELVVTAPGNKRPILTQKLTINAQGGFKQSLNVSACKNLAITVVTGDVSHKPFISLKTLIISSMPGCIGQA